MARIRARRDHRVLEQEQVLDMAGPLFGKSVLDIGCGDGTLATEFHRKGASFVVGCDPDPRMIAKAIAQTMAEPNAMSFLLGRAEHLPFDDQSFDVVTAITVLCFVTQRSRSMEEMARVLKPGGRVVIAGLGRWSTWAASRRVRAWLGNELGRHARFTTARELRTAAISAGLDVNRVRGAVYYPHCALAARAMKTLDLLLGGITSFGATQKLSNLVLVHTGEITKLNGTADRVLAINVLHELGDEALRALVGLLKPNGTVLAVDWNAGVERPVGPPRDHVYTAAEARERMERAGLQIEGERMFKYHYALLARRAS